MLLWWLPVLLMPVLLPHLLLLLLKESQLPAEKLWEELSTRQPAQELSAALQTAGLPAELLAALKADLRSALLLVYVS